MTEHILNLDKISFRHVMSNPKFLRPWNKRKGRGVKTISMKVNSGEIISLIGPNGAGKTTLMRIIAGINTPDSGNMIFNGKRISDAKSLNEMKRLVGHMPEQIRWKGKNTVYQTLKAFAEMRNDGHDQIDSLLKVVGLSSRSNTTLDELSQGMRQRMSLAVALIGSPKLLILDEPFNGLDPVAARAFEKLISELSTKGVAIIISSHQVERYTELSSKIALLHQGRLIAHGTQSELDKEFDLKQKVILSGIGNPPIDILEKQGVKILEQHLRDEKWTVKIIQPSEDLLKKLVQNNIDVTTYEIEKPDIVEMLCAATGQDIEQIGLEINELNTNNAKEEE